jgi:hypothetical protein
VDGRCDAAFGFLLERMKHPQICADLNGIDQPPSVASVSKRDFQHPRAQTLKGFGVVGLLPISGDSQRLSTFQLNRKRELLERLAGGLHPSDGARLAAHFSNVVIFDNNRNSPDCHLAACGPLG